jgi:hypothetical protein
MSFKSYNKIDYNFKIKEKNEKSYKRASNPLKVENGSSTGMITLIINLIEPTRGLLNLY